MDLLDIHGEAIPIAGQGQLISDTRKSGLASVACHTLPVEWEMGWSGWHSYMFLCLAAYAAVCVLELQVTHVTFSA